MIRAPPSSNRAERRFPFSSLFRSRKRCPWRVFFVCDRRIAAHVDCVPDAEHFFEGAVEDTLDQVHGRFAGRVVLAHADLGSGQPARDACTAAMLSSKLAWFMAPGGLIAPDQDLSLPEAESLALPAAHQPGRYFPIRSPVLGRQKRIAPRPYTTK